MCGIVGIGDYKPRAGQFEHKLFSQMLIANAMRGTDSTGIVKVYADGQSDWRKQVGVPYNLFESKSFMDWWKDYDKKDVRFLIGHNRFGTTGDTTVDNAHPFTCGNITLVHNGTLKAGLSNLPDFEKFKVDSEAIANSINVQGIQKTVDGMCGAYALVYYDEKAQTLNFIRNFERPLFLGMDDKMGRVYFASEKPMLEWILNRNDVVIPEKCIKEIPTNTLISFNLDELKPSVKKVEKNYSFFPTPPGDKAASGTVGPQNSDFSNVFDSIDLTKPSLPRPKESVSATSGKIITFPTQEKLSRKQKKRLASQTQMVCTPTTGNGKSGEYQTTSNLFGMKFGDRIPLDILDYQKMKGDTKRYLVESCLNNFNDIDVFMFVNGEVSMDGLLVTGRYTARIVSMEYNLEACKNVRKHHKIWVSDPIPTFNIGDTQDAEILEGISETSLVDHRDPALGD